MQQRKVTTNTTDWHHAPVHRLQTTGVYMVTAATAYKKHLFKAPEHLDLLQASLFDLSNKYAITLRAWALFPNHYHLILLRTEASLSLHQFLRHLHSESARSLNKLTNNTGRNVWYQFWDTEITYKDSYRARLNYVINNPVKHGLTNDATLYPWCSAQWFKNRASPGHYRTIMSYKSDAINVKDDF